jgi:hypothetical protein
MSKISSDQLNELINLFEKAIDARFEYLEERKFENYIYAHKIKEQKYDPIINDLYNVLKRLDFGK